MKLVYIAGPYRASTEYGVAQNILRAEQLAIKVWLAGAACICPHKNTAFLGGAAPDETWLRGDREIVSRCDAVVCLDGWRESIGASGEVALAESLGIPIFEHFADFEQWLKSPEPQSH
jgi:hypothetical protein